MEVDLVFSTVANSTYSSINRTKANRDSFSAELQIIEHWARQKTPKPQNSDAPVLHGMSISINHILSC